MQSTETLPNGLTLFQDDRFFKLGQDSVLLSAFARIPRRARVLDLGCGTGALALLCWRDDLTITGLELQPGPAGLFAQSIAQNGLENVRVVQGDLRDVRRLLPHASMQYVICNPPYFAQGTGKAAAGAARRAARQDASASLDDILDAIAAPARDYRDRYPQALLKSGVLELSDLHEGEELQGTVRNVVDFGAFVDIGLHEDGLVHISHICDRFIRHPSEAVRVGDIVTVQVLEVDRKRKRISLTMRGLSNER